MQKQSLTRTSSSETPKKKNNFGQAVALAGVVTTLGVVTDRGINSTGTPEFADFFKKNALALSLVGAGMLGCVYGLAKAIPPMWKEVTEFRQDKLPFYTSQIKLYD